MAGSALPYVLPLLYNAAGLAFLVLSSGADKLAEAAGPRVTRAAPAGGGGSGGGGGGGGLTATQRQLVLAGALSAIVQFLTMLPNADVEGVWHRLHDNMLLGVSTALVFGLLVLVPLLAPAWFQRHRTLLLMAFWTGFFSLPNEVPVLQHLGIVRDLFLLTLGTRTLALFLAGTLSPLPPLQHAVVASFAIYRVMSADYRKYDMCALPFMQRAAWQRWIAGWHRGVHLVLMADPYQPGVDSFSDCRQFVTCYQLLVGLLVPAVLGSSFLSADDQRSRSGGSSQGRQPGKGAVASLLAPLQLGCRWMESVLQRLWSLLGGRGSSTCSQLAAWWLVLHIVYATALGLEQRWHAGDQGVAGC